MLYPLSYGRDEGAVYPARGARGPSPARPSNGATGALAPRR
jgi:hypothetical protein